MFSQIFLFEIRYRLRRPAFYVYFAVVLAFTTLAFAKGDIGRVEKESVNAPAAVAEFCATMSIFLLLVSSAIMGTPLYRDLEHNTKEYYLSYPITKAGYFWGRFLGSFFFVSLISFAVILGVWLGCALGPVLGGAPAAQYGPNHLSGYFRPWLILCVPTLFFTSAFFFGLVAVFRNVKVIYSSGLFLFLGYILANFFLHNIHNNTVIYLADPFVQNGMRAALSGLSPDELNHYRLPLSGLIGYNRLLWVSVGAVVLAFTWWRFSFERFFSGRLTKDKRDNNPRPAPTASPETVHVELQGAYYRRTLFSLTRIELLNIIRDNYFWIILSGGYIFLSFVFSHGPGRFDTHDYPRTVFFVEIFTDIFLFFIFLIIIFYTGETVHREKLTRFAFINDSLPPPDWVLNTAKLLSLCLLAFFLALTPMLIGLPVQLLKGYSHLNLSQYLSSTFITILPRLIAMVLFCYSIHLVVNNKFAAHGIAISIWIVLFCVIVFNYFRYFPLLYSYGPGVWASDMDGIGHMKGPINWFNGYWTIAGSLMVVMSGLFFARGVPRSFRERLSLARQRFHGPTCLGAGILLAGFLTLGAYVYYNVSYLHEYLTPWEQNERRALVEKGLKQYAGLPQPRITRLAMKLDLFPDQQREETNAVITVMNLSNRPIDTLLIDGDGLDFGLSYKGVPLNYTCPLYFPRGKFNFLRSAHEPSDYRLYILPTSLRPGDSARVELQSTVAFRGFQNFNFGANALSNGMFTTGNLPGLGYDDDDEIDNNDTRLAHGLAEKHEKDIPWDDSVGRRSIFSGISADLMPYDLTVSTSADQSVQASGRLEKEWTEGGRHYYRFVQDHPGLYPPVAVGTARYAQWTDTVQLEGGRIVQVGIDYHPEHSANLKSYQAALKDGLRFYSRIFGPYPYDRLFLAESSAYSRSEHTTPGVIFFPEHIGWVADLRSPQSFDYPYYLVSIQLARQWWGLSVAPNNTLASRSIDLGISHYAALALLGQYKDSSSLQTALGALGWDYSWGHRTDHDGERPLINANKWYEWDHRTTLQLRTLAQTIGADSLHSALRAFYQQWALHNGGPYPGAHDLYNTLAAHTPDSLRTWLADSWLKTPTGPPAPPSHASAPTARR